MFKWWNRLSLIQRALIGFVMLILFLALLSFTGVIE